MRINSFSRKTKISRTKASSESIHLPCQLSPAARITERTSDVLYRRVVQSFRYRCSPTVSRSIRTRIGVRTLFLDIIWLRTDHNVRRVRLSAYFTKTQLHQHTPVVSTTTPVATTNLLNTLYITNTIRHTPPEELVFLITLNQSPELAKLFAL